MIAFLKRWWKWVGAALLLLASMSAVHRANKERERSNQRLRDDMREDFDEANAAVDDHTVDFLNSNERAKQANEKLKKALDRAAEPDVSVRDVISDWNARDRLHDDEDAA